MSRSGTVDARLAAAPAGTARRSLVVAGIAHALHDGYTDLIYVMLPVWQHEFGLDYVALALLRGLYSSAMAALQIPAGRLGSRFGARLVLTLGTLLSALGYGLAGFSGGLVGLLVALTISGAGASVQHPIASAVVSRAYGAKARGPLGTYNFAGDLGKAAIPALLSFLLTWMHWRAALWVVAAIGLVVAAIILSLMPARRRDGAAEAPKPAKAGKGRGGFPLLFAIGVLDSGVRMGLLTFLPFLLKAKGADLPLVGTALALVFLGGAAGKITCGWLGMRLGVLWTVLITEAGTAALILAVLALPLVPVLILLPLLGLFLNGTSSILYGTVPELAPPGRTEQSFALFYTGTIGSGALSPILYGLVGDALGPVWAVATTALVALCICPLAVALAPRLSEPAPT